VFKLKKMTFATPAVLTGSSPATQLEHQHEARGHQHLLHHRHHTVFIPDLGHGVAVGLNVRVAQRAFANQYQFPSEYNPVV
jgi:hypothetical protein